MSTQDSEQAQDFAVVLMAVGGGRLHARLSEQLAAVSAAVVETGKKGTVTLKLTVAPLPRADPNTLVVTGSSASNVPEPDESSPTSIFFADDGGNLSRTDPRQMTLPFRDSAKEQA